MEQLPIEFTSATRLLMGEERFARYLQSFDADVPVSIRLNPQKTAGWSVEGSPVPWCRQGYYLSQRPNFTFDPLLHAGCYYVQEAASMFLDTVLAQHLPPQPLTMLDLCAAPGGKSTLARTALSADSVLYSNEPMRNRASILAENVQKWGGAQHIVTCNYPKDYRRSRLRFDVILCDVPCSGEGMFRKDAATIREWSPQNVEKCWQLQRDIVSEAWTCLAEGGLLIYSTCTFNTKENEENIRWMQTQLGAEVLPVETCEQWNITGSLLDGFQAPVYRFIPGITRGEGLFMCVLRKGGQWQPEVTRKNNVRVKDPHLNILDPLSPIDGKAPQVALSYPQALAYLRREALTLPADTPRGLVTVCFEGHPLGMVKNIGNRANNLYPKEWKIKTTHLPQTYETILNRL